MESDLKELLYDTEFVTRKNNSVLQYSNPNNTVFIFVKPINGKIVKVLIREGPGFLKPYSKIFINNKTSKPKANSIFFNKSNGTITTPSFDKYHCDDFFTNYLPIIRFDNPRYFYFKERTRVLKKHLPYLIYYIRYFYDVSNNDICMAECYIISDLVKHFDCLPNVPKQAKFQLPYHAICNTVGFLFSSATEINISKKEYSEAIIQSDSFTPNYPKLVFELDFFMNYMRKFVN